MALFTIAKTWKQRARLPIDEWIQLWRVHAVEYYSALKRDEVMPCAGAWVDLEIIILGGGSQADTDRYHYDTSYM